MLSSDHTFTRYIDMYSSEMFAYWSRCLDWRGDPSRLNGWDWSLLQYCMFYGESVRDAGGCCCSFEHAITLIEVNLPTTTNIFSPLCNVVEIGWKWSRLELQGRFIIRDECRQVQGQFNCRHVVFYTRQFYSSNSTTCRDTLVAPTVAGTFMFLFPQTVLIDVAIEHQVPYLSEDSPSNSTIGGCSCPKPTGVSLA